MRQVQPDLPVERQRIEEYAQHLRDPRGTEDRQARRQVNAIWLGSDGGGEVIEHFGDVRSPDLPAHRAPQTWLPCLR